MNTILSSMSVLLVEDDELSNKNTTYMLQNYFKDVLSCYDGKEAYTLYLEYSPSVIITDIEMPKINGLDLCKKIRKKDISTPIVIITSFAHNHYLLEALELGLTSYLVKPLTSTSFDKMINKLQQHFMQTTIKPYYFSENIYYDFKKKIIQDHNKSIPLSNQEIYVLEEFLNNKNQLLESEYLKEKFDLNSNSLNLTISRIRKKIPKNKIQTIYSQGYRLNDGL
jgi:DNA-binding response OmpR family regulator